MDSNMVEEDVVEMAIEYNKREDKISELEKEMMKKEERIIEMEMEMKMKDEKIEKMERKIARRDEHIQHYQRKVPKLKAKVASQREQLVWLNEFNNELIQQTDDYEKGEDEWHDVLDRKVEELDRVTAQLTHTLEIVEQMKEMMSKIELK